MLHEVSDVLIEIMHDPSNHGFLLIFFSSCPWLFSFNYALKMVINVIHSYIFFKSLTTTKHQSSILSNAQQPSRSNTASSWHMFSNIFYFISIFKCTDRGLVINYIYNIYIDFVYGYYIYGYYTYGY